MRVARLLEIGLSSASPKRKNTLSAQPSYGEVPVTAVQCQICPKACLIQPGECGDCRIRVNFEGRLRAVTYGYPSAMHIDPIEKKPMNHFLPGSAVFSIATVGCNLHCRNCQNWDLSQRDPADAEAFPLPPERIPEAARQNGCACVAYTYSDPSAYYEYALDSSIRCREAGLQNILVTAGYLNEAPARELYRHAAGVTIDVKAMSEEFYRDVCNATLAPVLRTLVLAKSLGVILEVSNLLIPTLNDRDEDIRSLCRWMVENLGRETPLHFLRFHPQYRMRHLPPTPASSLSRARDLARAEGLHFVYVGNLLAADAGTTRCPNCRAELVRRTGYAVDVNRLVRGRCPDCQTEIYGKWN